jgi:hypothetical protein
MFSNRWSCAVAKVCIQQWSVHGIPRLRRSNVISGGTLPTATSNYRYIPVVILLWLLWMSTLHKLLPGIMVHECTSRHQQEPSNGHHLEPVKSNAHLFMEINFENMMVKKWKKIDHQDCSYNTVNHTQITPHCGDEMNSISSEWFSLSVLMCRLCLFSTCQKRSSILNSQWIWHISQISHIKQTMLKQNLE